MNTKAVDGFTRALLLIIALCLIWICMRDLHFGALPLQGAPKEMTDVNIAGADGFALQWAGPMEVHGAVEMENYDDLARAIARYLRENVPIE